jgi:COP9 signalosome complex subunit 4
MASPQVAQALEKIRTTSSTQPDNRVSSMYDGLLQKVLENSTGSQLTADLQAILGSLLGDSLGIVAARPLLSSFIEALKTIKSSDTKTEVGQQALTLLESRVVSFEEQDASIREMLADVYESEEDWSGAAKVLQGVQLESTQRMTSDDEKAKVWIRITRNFLEEDDTTNAETYLNRAKNVMYKCQDQELKLHFQLSQARILDSKRKFLDACQSYHTLSFYPIIAEEERLRALSAATICAILAPAGPQRSRALARLYKDERSSQVDEFSILEKMFFDRLLTAAEVNAFSKKLAHHQLATTADGSTVLAKAVTEHNLLGASRLYENIVTSDLGSLLDLSAEQAEGYAARMIEQGRLAGRIDQIDQIIYFDGAEGTGEKTAAGQADNVVGRELRRWDSNVQGIAEEVEKVTTLLQNEYPVRVPASQILEPC